MSHVKTLFIRTNQKKITLLGSAFIFQILWDHRLTFVSSWLWKERYPNLVKYWPPKLWNNHTTLSMTFVIRTCAFLNFLDEEYPFLKPITIKAQFTRMYPTLKPWSCVIGITDFIKHALAYFPKMLNQTLWKKDVIPTSWNHIHTYSHLGTWTH